MEARQRNRADAMASLRADVISMIAVMSGEFDERIEELLKLKKGIDDKTKTMVTLEEAERLKAQAAEQVRQASENIEILLNDAQGRVERINFREQEVKEAETSVSMREEDLARGREGLAIATAEFESFSAGVRARLSEQEGRAAKMESEAAHKLADVEDLKRRLADRLAALERVA